MKELTALDWIAVVLVGVGALFCIGFPFLIAPAFAAMFADFGTREALPQLTRLGLTIWFPLMLGLNPASIAFYALSGHHTLGRRRLLIVVAFVLSLLASGLCLAAMYAPVFALAGKIK